MVDRARLKTRLGMMHRAGLEIWSRMDVLTWLDGRAGMDQGVGLLGIDRAHGAGDELDHFEVRAGDEQRNRGRIHE